ncbi:hypothetical protein WDH52_04110 [Streptomyces sp. TRM70308]|uniref:hypothetical protein n=1 Tax=Streptomyces sp. TRM70308 TaxID=3131932 RepID=UPI003D02EAF8
MAALVWWVIPLLGTVCAVSWALWAARQSSERGSGDVAGVAGYDAFRAAMERSAARHRPAPPAALGRISTDGPSRIPTDGPSRIPTDGPSRRAD